jgi:hypothetical protein
MKERVPRTSPQPLSSEERGYHVWAHERKHVCPTMALSVVSESIRD